MVISFTFSSSSKSNCVPWSYTHCLSSFNNLFDYVKHQVIIISEKAAFDFLFQINECFHIKFIFIPICAQSSTQYSYFSHPLLLSWRSRFLLSFSSSVSALSSFLSL